tara:strand:+ start:323 stop:1021 length:699 start_codon:yes stop_codon:yes gene_type:complete
LLKNSLLVLLIVCLTTVTFATDTNTQSNQSGSNTNITGGYTATTNNTYSGGQTNTTTNSTTSTTNGSDIPPPSANSPSYSSMSQDVCSMGISGSVSTGVFGLSGGKHVVDENCERIKLAKVLQDFGMKVASVAVLCQDPRVFQAMESAGTPCPFEGKIGKEAADLWATYVELRPDYEWHMRKIELKGKVDAAIMLEEEKQRAAEEKQKEIKETYVKKESTHNSTLPNIAPHK